MMRVQFTITESEKEELDKLANENGYPDISTFCKDTVLKVKTYADLWSIVKNKIEKMPSGTTFLLRDLIDNPPSNLGVKLHKNQENLKIEKVKKDNSISVFKKK